MLVTVARYRDITADTGTASAVVEDALTDAQALLEEELGRELESDTRTERCRVFAESRGGTVYPSVTPITSVSDPSSASILGHAVVGGTVATGPPYFLTDPDGFASVTYVGGYASGAAPTAIERAIAWAARALVDPDTFAQAPPGATSATVGDVSITWGPGGAPSQGEVVFDRRLVRRWRRRRELVA